MSTFDSYCGVRMQPFPAPSLSVAAHPSSGGSVFLSPTWLGVGRGFLVGGSGWTRGGQTLLSRCHGCPGGLCKGPGRASCRPWGAPVTMPGPWEARPLGCEAREGSEAGRRTLCVMGPLSCGQRRSRAWGCVQPPAVCYLRGSDRAEVPAAWERSPTQWGSSWQLGLTAQGQGEGSAPSGTADSSATWQLLSLRWRCLQCPCGHHP